MLMKPFVTSALVALSIAGLVCSVSKSAHADWQEGELEAAETPFEFAFGFNNGSSTAHADVSTITLPGNPVPLTLGRAETHAFASPGGLPTYYQGSASITLRRVCTWNEIGPPSTISWQDMWVWAQTRSGTYAGTSIQFGNTSITSAAGTVSNNGSANTGSFSFTIQGSISTFSSAGDVSGMNVQQGGTADAAAYRFFELH